MTFAAIRAREALSASAVPKHCRPGRIRRGELAKLCPLSHYLPLTSLKPRSVNLHRENTVPGVPPKPNIHLTFEGVADTRFA